MNAWYVLLNYLLTVFLEKGKGIYFKFHDSKEAPGGNEDRVYSTKLISIWILEHEKGHFNLNFSYIF